MIKCMVVDDHAVIREGVKMLFAETEDIVVGWEASNGPEAVELVDEMADSDEVPDVILMDFRMGAGMMDGVEASQRVLRYNPDIRVILFTAFTDRHIMHRGLDAGARGFVLKGASGDQIIESVHSVMRGDVYVDSAVAPTLLTEIVLDTVSSLTKREREVIALIAEGKTTDEIAKQLVISQETVKTHANRILRKLKAENRTQAVAIAMRQHLIE